MVIAKFVTTGISFQIFFNIFLDLNGIHGERVFSKSVERLIWISPYCTSYRLLSHSIIFLRCAYNKKTIGNKCSLHYAISVKWKKIQSILYYSVMNLDPVVCNSLYYTLIEHYNAVLTFVIFCMGEIERRVWFCFFCCFKLKPA